MSRLQMYQIEGKHVCMAKRSTVSHSMRAAEAAAGREGVRRGDIASGTFCDSGYFARRAGTWDSNELVLVEKNYFPCD